MTPPPRNRRSWAPCGLVLVLAAVVAAGCDEQQNALAPKSHQSTDIASLFWWMMGIAWGGLALVVGLLLLAWRRAHTRPGHSPKEGETLAYRVVVGGGVALPIVLI